MQTASCCGRRNWADQRSRPATRPSWTAWPAGGRSRPSAEPRSGLLEEAGLQDQALDLVRVAFDVRCKHEKAPPGYKWIPKRLIFDIKMDFTRKARLVAGGHMTDPPSDMTYSSAVSRESVHIAFLIAALNSLETQSADIGNAYLNASTNEKVYTTADPEFGADEAKTIIIV